MRPLALLVLCGCTQHVNPCAGRAGACVGVHLDSEVRPLDEILVTLDGAASRRTPNPPSTLAFPVRFAVELPAGPHSLGFAGLRGGVEQAWAQANVNAAPHAEVSVTLRQFAADLSVPQDLAPVDLIAADLAGADFAGVDFAQVDLATHPDLSAVDLAGADLAGADLSGVSYPVTVTRVGTGGGALAIDGNSCLSPCSVMRPAGASITIATTPDPESALVAFTGACTSTTTNCSFTVNAPSSVAVHLKSTTRTAVTVVPVSLSVTNSSLLLTPTPPPLASCGTNCFLFNNNASVTLNASVTNGVFLGWGGSASCNFKPSCVIDLTGDVGLTASWSDAAMNYAFVTSTTHTPMQLNMAATPQTMADGFCQMRATAAGLPDIASYKAWLSVTGTLAPSRLAGAAGWVRTDGLPVASTVNGLLANPLYPIGLDENGAYTTGGAWTGTNTDGTLAANCTNWTETSGSAGQYGVANDGSTAWTQYSTLTCGNAAALYCFGTARNRALTFNPPPGARRAFVTMGVADGVGDFDNRCQIEAAAASLSGRFRAYLNKSTAGGIMVFNQTAGPWVRLDNVILSPLAATTMLEADIPQRVAPLMLQADGIALDLNQRAWVGSASTNCQNWSVPDGDFGADTPVTRMRGSVNSNQCNNSRHWYCLQE